MKVSVEIEVTIARALANRYNVEQLQNALDSEYNDTGKGCIAIVKEESGIKSASANDKKELFKSRDGIDIQREGKLNDPRRMIAWLVNWKKFVKANGIPNGEVTADTLPANLVFWLETKFLKPGVESNLPAAVGVVSTGKRNGRNGGVTHVKAPEVPAAAVK